MTSKNMKNFEEYLKEIHAELFPQLLDDDMPDHFDDWLGSLDGEEYINYADLYGEAIKKEFVNNKYNG